MANGKRWQKMDWQDPFLLEQQLTDEQRMVRDSARQYAQNKLLPRVQNAFRKEETDPELFREMGALGLLGSTIDGYGCSAIAGKTVALGVPGESTTFAPFLGRENILLLPVGIIIPACTELPLSWTSAFPTTTRTRK